MIAASGFDCKVIVNDSHTREAVSRDQMRKFLPFVKENGRYCMYYDAMYILFHTGLRISEFLGLAVIQDFFSLIRTTTRWRQCIEPQIVQNGISWYKFA